MRHLLDLNNKEAKDYFLKNKSYINFDIPIYFDFSNLLKEIYKKISTKSKITTFFIKDSKNKPKSPKIYENVNYKLLHNKNGSYEWRPFEIIHPFLYSFLVKTITEKENWQTLQDRFSYFKNNSFIECVSIPIVLNKNKPSKGEQIIKWWSDFEQKSISLGLDFEYIFETDITNCYASIYTHSIAWAIHDKEIIKENRINKINDNELLGNKIDEQLMNMSNGQTNGIPQGSILMDFIAEIVLGYADIILTDKLKNFDISKFKILRYRDDYRIFTNDNQLGGEILKNLSEVLQGLGLKLCVGKTKNTGDIVKSSIKEDKYYTIHNLTFHKTLIKKLYFVKTISDNFPNSGSVIILLQEFDKKLRKFKKINENIDVLISIIVNIMIKNPRTYNISSSILSRFINEIEELDKKKEIINKIITKFEKIPNTGHLELWLQRIILKLGVDIDFKGDLSKKVLDNNIVIWNSDWLLEGDITKLIKETLIIDNEIIKGLDVVINRDEIKIFDY